MFGRLEVFKYKIIFRSHPGPPPIPSLLSSHLTGQIFYLRCTCWRSDEGGPKAFKAPLDAGAGRSINAVQGLELLCAQLVVSQAVLPVEGLCRCTVKGGLTKSENRAKERVSLILSYIYCLYFLSTDNIVNIRYVCHGVV